MKMIPAFIFSKNDKFVYLFADIVDALLMHKKQLVGLDWPGFSQSFHFNENVNPLFSIVFRCTKMNDFFVLLGGLNQIFEYFSNKFASMMHFLQ